MELLSPAGSPEAVVAAVQNGADAIYLGFGAFNARKNAQNFSDDEFESAVRYCRVRGCKVYVTLNTLVSDREMGEAVRLARLANALGADGIIIQDIGLCSIIKAVTPNLPIHASTQMSVHNLAGVQAAAELGASRVVLARELSLGDIAFIAERSPIEIEVFAHGALCVCYSGQCYMSSLIGRRSGNRGLCAQPCRLEYSMGGRMDSYPLSLKDNCLIDHLAELEKAGVACLKIEGRMKRPEYTAVVTGIYSRALREKIPPSREELEQLKTAFSRQGFTDGYLMAKAGSDMFGVRLEPDEAQAKLYSEIKRAYSASELRRVPISFYAMIKAGENSKFIAEDLDGRRVSFDGPIPQKAANAQLTEESLTEQLYKTGGTPYACQSVRAAVEPGLFLPVSELNEIRRTLISRLTEQRKLPPARESGHMPSPVLNLFRREAPVTNFQFTAREQMTDAMAAMAPNRVYVPFELLDEDFSCILPFTEKGAEIVCVLPRVYNLSQSAEIRKILARIRSLGVSEALIGNLGHIRDARQSGFKLRADFGMNVFNSNSLNILKRAGFISAAASFELRLAQIADLQKPLDTELIAYGRLPLMILEQCVIKTGTGHCSCQNFAQNQLSDRQGALFTVLKEYGCRNTILNSKKLFMADKREDYTKIGLWGIRLMFTTENSKECLQIAKAYSGETDYIPNGITRGLYYRGVE